MREGKRIINIDETWLPQMDFRTHKWRARGEKNTHREYPLTSRVNLIAALDTNGNVYASLTQVNTDSDVMIAFLNRLVIVLANESKDFRNDTIIVLDGAAYHRSAETRDTFRKLGLKVLITGPYSYDSSPCELLFAYFKQTNLNPSNISTGKK